MTDDPKPPTWFGRFHADANRVLELSLREALAHGHNYIGSEHLILGLLREDTSAKDLLVDCGLREQDLRTAAHRGFVAARDQIVLTSEEEGPTAQDTVDALRFALSAKNEAAEVVKIVERILDEAPENAQGDRGLDHGQGLHLEPACRGSRCCPRESTDDAVLDVSSTDGWIALTRFYEGEGNAVDTMSMTEAEFRWLIAQAPALSREGS